MSSRAAARVRADSRPGGRDRIHRPVVGRPPAEGPAAGPEEAFQSDPEAFRRLRIETPKAVMYHDVIRTMSTARINILTQRPVLRHLKHLTLKYFEIFCADTIPLLMLDADHAEAVYGPAARELVLPGQRRGEAARCSAASGPLQGHRRGCPPPSDRALLLRPAGRGAGRRASELIRPASQRSRAMKLVFVYWGYENAGSMLDLRGYARAARTMGHEVTVYGPPNPKFALDYSQDLDGADAVIFVFEWTTALQFGDRLDWTRLLEAVPRRRRVVIDCDGAYNDPIEFGGDYNHRNEESSRYWTDVCDSLSDKIFQPTYRPRRQNVRPFLFHIYDPTWETPLDFADKEFAMVYVGHTKFRWRGMSKVLRGDRAGAGPGRPRGAGRRGLGLARRTGCNGMTSSQLLCRSRLSEKDRASRHCRAVPYPQVAATISKGVFNPVVYRPLFECLGMVTCRTFETPAAGTIPLFLLDRGLCRGDLRRAAIELVLDGEHAHEKIARRARAARALRGDRHGNPGGFWPAAQPRGASARVARVHRGVSRGAQRNRR